jgi:hypothetical protein
VLLLQLLYWAQQQLLPPVVVLTLRKLSWWG